MASSVALVSDRSPNLTASSPQLHPSVSGDQDPAVALWGGRQGPAQVRHTHHSPMLLHAATGCYWLLHAATRCYMLLLLVAATGCYC